MRTCVWKWIKSVCWHGSEFDVERLLGREIQTMFLATLIGDEGGRVNLSKSSAFSFCV